MQEKFLFFVKNNKLQEMKELLLQCQNKEIQNYLLNQKDRVNNNNILNSSKSEF